MEVGGRINVGYLQPLTTVEGDSAGRAQEEGAQGRERTQGGTGRKRAEEGTENNA